MPKLTPEIPQDPQDYNPVRALVTNTPASSLASQAAITPPTLADIPQDILVGVPPRHQRLALHLYAGKSWPAALRAEGYKLNAAGALSTGKASGPRTEAAMGKIQRIINALLVEFSVRAGTSKIWIRANLVRLYERASQVEQVIDRKGNPTGMYTLDVAGARGCLELLGKDLGMFGARTTSGDSIPTDAVAQLLAAVANRGRPALPGDRARVIEADQSGATR